MKIRISRPMQRPLMLFAIGLLVTVLAACGAGAQFANVGDNLEGGGDRGEAAAPSSAPAPAGEGGGGGQQDAYQALADRKIIKTGEVTLEVTSVATAVGQLRAMALELDGYVGDSSAGGAEDAATLTLRIPADRFDAAIERLHAMDATLRAEATKEQDVTGSLVDLQARIRNLEASEQQYRLLVERAEKIEDILSVQSRLDDVRGQIEQLKAQLEQLSGLASLATLTVTLVPASTPVADATEGWDPGATFNQALAALVGAGQGLANVLIWLAIVGLPILVVVGVVALVVTRLTPAWRRRVPRPE